MISSLILALEFSSDRRSVALVQAGKVLAESVQELGRSTRVFTLVTDTLKLANLTPAAVTAIAVGIGPGSYTGIRLAISVAQGWALANQDRALRIFGIDSFEVLAAEFTGSAWLASDAQREEWAVARVQASRVVEGARLITTQQLRDLARTERVVGPDVLRALGIGETGFPSAGRLGMIAETRTDSVAAESLAPVYLRTAAFVKAPTPRSLTGIADTDRKRTKEPFPV